MDSNAVFQYHSQPHQLLGLNVPGHCQTPCFGASVFWLLTTSFQGLYGVREVVTGCQKVAPEILPLPSSYRSILCILTVSHASRRLVCIIFRQNLNLILLLTSIILCLIFLTLLYLLAYLGVTRNTVISGTTHLYTYMTADMSSLISIWWIVFIPKCYIKQHSHQFFKWRCSKHQIQ